MSALRSSALERCILTELGLAGDYNLSKKALRERVSDELGPIGAVEFEAAIRSLRYRGKLHWAKLDLPESTRSDESTKSTPVAPLPAADGPEVIPSTSGPNDADDPGKVNDRSQFTGPSSKSLHCSSSHQRRKLPPVPTHESEVRRALRQDCEESFARRGQARSTGTVKAPLEIRRLMLPDPTLAEAIETAFAAEPHDLIASLNRKHPQLWRRVIALGRATGRRPAAVLYDCIEAGLDSLEPHPQANAA